MSAVEPGIEVTSAAHDENGAEVSHARLPRLAGALARPVALHERPPALSAVAPAAAAR